MTSIGKLNYHFMAQSARTYLVSISLLVLILYNPSVAQDTVKVTLNQFIERGIQNSGQVKFQRQEVDLAENQVIEARSLRYLPNAELNTNHGLIPGVNSDSTLPSGRPLPEGQFYLDPNLTNDWQNWAIFNRAEARAIQPIYAFGAINNAIKAAKEGAEAAQFQFDSKKTETALRLYELYYSYILALEMERLLDEAQERIQKIDKELQKQEESGDSDLDYSDVYKFRVFKSQFEIQVSRVKYNNRFIRATWKYVMQADDKTVFVPANRFLDPVISEIKPITYYRETALKDRAELKGIDAGIRAAKFGLNAAQAQNLPMFYVGLTASFAHTPNRPRQENPFIINNTNFLNAGFGFGIRQNLNFFSIKSQIQKSQIEYSKVKFLREAAVEGINIEINERFKNAHITESRFRKSKESLNISKEWLRQEQLDYDIGFGDVKDLLDAMKSKLELEVALKQSTFDFNVAMGRLYRTAGLSVEQLSLN